jgi:hypothetical protein
VGFVGGLGLVLLQDLDVGRGLEALHRPESADQSRYTEGTFRKHSVNIPETFRDVSVNIQGTFREKSGLIQVVELKRTPVGLHPNCKKHP